jgi:hypothetical protein
VNSEDLNQFNCLRCGHPNYNHGPSRGPTVCDKFQNAKVTNATISSEASAITHIEARMPDEERERLSTVLADVRKAFVLQWARLSQEKDPRP